MKVVFVQPNVGFKGHTWEALGIGYIISSLEQRMGSDLETEFYSGFYDSDATIIDACEDADFISFSCTSPQYKHALKLASEIKTSKNRTVFGGIHPSVLPNEVIKQSAVDAIIVGEGEVQLFDLIKEYESSMHSGCGIFIAPKIEDINRLPYPDRIAIKNERNIQQAYRDMGVRITSTISSRGCPFKCTFCCSKNLWGNAVRYRSPENILGEMIQLEKMWNIQLLKFADDTFTINKNRLLKFCSMKQDMGVKMPFGANAHVNTIDREVMAALADANCKELWFGVESGSPRILTEMRKATDIEKIKVAFKLAKEYGIKTRAYCLLGMRSETLEDIHLTEQLIDEIEPDVVGFTLLAPYPMNEYYDHATMKDWDWSTFDEYSNSWVKTETLSNAQLKMEQCRLVEKYHQIATFRQKR